MLVRAEISERNEFEDTPAKAWASIQNGTA
jgi:hypothetical protein